MVQLLFQGIYRKAGIATLTITADFKLIIACLEKAPFPIIFFFQDFIVSIIPFICVIRYKTLDFI